MLVWGIRANMSWDALTAVSSVFQAALLLVAGCIALYQLLEMRRSGQFEATRTMIDRMLDPSFFAAVMYVVNDLPKRMEDPQFRAELILESWERLGDVVTLMRASHRNPNVWANAQFLYEFTKARRPAVEKRIADKG